MDINELEDLIDNETATALLQEAPNTEPLIINPDELPPNVSNTGEALSSPEELMRILAGLSKGEVHLIRMEGPNTEGVSVVCFENNNRARATYRVNRVWRESIVQGAEAFAVVQGAAVTPNSPSLEMDVSTSRFSGAIWYEKIKEQEIVLAGIGGIGSYVAYLLGRMKPMRLIMYDPDKVERVNMSGQLYSRKDLGKYKVSAMRDMLMDYCEFSADCYGDPYGESKATRPIMICGFDNMEARRMFYNKWKRGVLASADKSNFLFIDGRLAAEEYQVFAIQGDDDRAMKEYEDKWLFSDAEAEETVCSYKQTTFMANMIASTMVNIFVNFVANLCNPPFPREVPFFTSYDASTMFTKVEL